MDISAQKQQYQALQAARAELVESAVNEIASHLDGLDPDVCDEILSKLRLKMTGQGMPTSPMPKEVSPESAKRIERHRQLYPPRKTSLLSDPVQPLNKEAILKHAAELWK